MSTTPTSLAPPSAPPGAPPTAKDAELERFVAAAAHDLSEPLRVIDGFVSALARRYEGALDEEADRFIGFTLAGVERMQALIDGLLAFARASQAPIELAPVDTAALLDEALQALVVAIVERGVRVDVGPLPIVRAEPTLLRAVFQNLLANAVKFAGAGTAAPLISVSAARERDAWRFDVADNGPGVPEAARGRIFDLFARAHGDEVAGGGIGLAIAKRIVERHGGSIGVRPGDADGSIFSFTVPAAAHSQA